MTFAEQFLQHNTKVLLTPFCSYRLLGVNDLSTIPIQDEPDIDCNSFSLTTHQKEYCQYAPELLNVIALGTRLGILECQSIFSVSRWNCTTFVGNDLFGSFVNTCKCLLRKKCMVHFSGRREEMGKVGNLNVPASKRVCKLTDKVDPVIFSDPDPQTILDLKVQYSGKT